MAEVQDERSRLGRMLRSSVTMGSYFVIPVMFGLAAVSESVVRLLLTEKWLPCVPYMQWLCVSNAAIPIISSNLIAIKSSGRSDIYMRLEMVRRIVMLAVLSVSVFVFRSVLVIAIGCCISNWLDAVICMLPAKRLMDYGIGSQLTDHWKIIFSAAVMFVFVQWLNMLSWHIGLLLPLQILTGIIVYLVMGSILDMEPQKNVIALATNLLNRKKQ